jgi:NADH-quinone oxidoreductase chain G
MMMDQETVSEQMESTQVSLTIDGRKISAAPKQTVLEAAAANGIYIPTLCYLKELSPIGSCRVCLVEVEGTDHPLAACQLPVAEGMQVTTQSDQLNELRRTMVQLLLVNHPLDCPVCERSGECRLQNLTYELGITQQTFAAQPPERTKHLDWQVVRYNPNLCVLCERCVRVCNEVQGVAAYRIRDNGYRSVIDTRDGQPLNCDFCGRCISVCPVGALTSGLGLPARSWELQKVASVCPFCGTGCSVELQVKKDRICRVSADPAQGINQGNLCARGRFGFQFIDHEQRLRTPLIRRDGKLTPAGWDETLDFVADKLQAIKKEHGAAAIAGIGSERLPNEDNYLFQKFFKESLGSSRIDNLWNMQNTCAASPSAGPSTEDLLKADLVLTVGIEPAEDNPVIGNLLRQAMHTNNAVLVTLSDRHVRFKPPARAALVHAPGREAELIKGLAEALDDGTVPQDAATAGVAAGALQNAARLLSQAKSAVILCGRRIMATSAYDELLALADRIRAKMLIYSEYCNSRGVNDMGVLPEAGVRILEAAGAGEVKALYVMGEDPLTRWHSGADIQDALKKVDFLIVQDIFATPTAELADVVLPSVSFAERQGTVTNMEGRVQKLNPALSPRGEGRADWQILTALAQRLGSRFDYASPEDILREIAGAIPAYADISYATIGANGRLAQYTAAGATLPRAQANPAQEDQADAGLVLLEGGAFFHLGPYSFRSAALLRLDPQCCALINPDDARTLNLADGDDVTVTSAEGSLKVKARITERVRPGTVFLPDNYEPAPVNRLRPAHNGLTRVKLAKADGNS